MAPEQNTRRMIREAKNLIEHSPAMTLATASENRPWAAPVYYVNCGSGFYFFSSPNARHIQDALASGHAACAIYAEDAAWQNLAGLQMSGRIMTIPASLEASKVIVAYVRKFPVVKSFFSSIKKIDVNDFSSKFRATLYCFTPDFIFFMNNSVQFGFREEINRDALFQ